MELIVVRHALAEDRDHRRWPDDRDRPLTEEGIVAFRRAARGLARVATVDAVYSSPLTRAWQTAGILTEEAGWPEPIPCEELEPDQRPQAILEKLGGEVHRTVAVVGHEPHLGETISYLMTGTRAGMNASLKKGGAARLDLDGVKPGGAVLRWFLPPKVARAIG